MTTIEHVRVSQIQETVDSLHLPADTRLTLIIEDREKTGQDFDQQEALDALEKLKGSGNGKLLDMLLQEREKEALL